MRADEPLTAADIIVAAGITPLQQALSLKAVRAK